MIVAIEADVEVGSVLYRGIGIWSLVRDLIYHHIKVVPDRFDNEAATLRAHRILADIEDRHHPRADGRQVAEFLRELRSKRPRHGVDVVMLSTEAVHRKEPDGLYHDSFVDPYYLAFARNHTVAKIEVVTRLAPHHALRACPTLMLTHPAFRRHRLGEPARVEGLAEVNQVLARYGVDPVDEGALADKMEVVLAYAELFRVHLEKLRPRLATTSCYYDTAAFGLIKACRDLSIPVVDLQHGGNADMHCCYFHFTKIPPEGYALLPDLFWVWNDYSKRRIERSMPPELRRHRAVVGGNLNLARFADLTADAVPPAYRDYLAELGRWRKTILVAPSTLFGNDRAADFQQMSLVFDTMERAPKDWCWLIRAHPTFHTAADCAEWEDELARRGIINCVFGLTHQIPLGLLLPHCDHVVTSWSGLCFDALAWRVPCTFTSELAWTYTPHGIEHGYFLLATSPAQLIANIGRAGRGDIDGGDATPVVDPAVAQATIELLLGD